MEKKMKQIKEWLQKNREKGTRFLQRLVQEGSIRGSESQAQAIIIEKCRELGLKLDIWEIGEERLLKHPDFYSDRKNFSGNPNVVAVLSGSGGGKSIILNGHIDVVPEGNLNDWENEPFSGFVKDGRLYGRGSTDMKGGTASLLLALEAIISCGIPLKGDVIFQSVIEEESGGAGTLAAVLRGYKADGAIIPEPTNMKIFPKDYTTIKRLSEQLIDLQKKMLPLKENTRKRTVKYTLTDFLTQNPYLIALKKEAEQLSKTQSSILVFGESGTGKEIFVQGIHNASSRSQGPFIAQNCAAIPEALLESILFGTAKGSYTGALDRPGLFELANGGTLFLDEIHEMPVDLQVKLLRVLEDGVVLRVGGVKSFFVDVRVIAAMNVHPKQAIEEKRLRPDLFYRLNVLTFELLPLRKRREDILYLTKNLITEFNMLFHKKVFGVDKDVEGLFLRYSWPGNVRELKHTIEYMMNICEESVLTKQVLPVMLKEQISGGTESSSGEDRGHVPFREMMELYERKLIEKALGSADGNIKKAAERLEIPRQTLQYKLKKYKLKDAK